MQDSYAVDVYLFLLILNRNEGGKGNKKIGSFQLLTKIAKEEGREGLYRGYLI